MVYLIAGPKTRFEDLKNQLSERAGDVSLKIHTPEKEVVEDILATTSIICELHIPEEVSLYTLNFVVSIWEKSDYRAVGHFIDGQPFYFQKEILLRH